MELDGVTFDPQGFRTASASFNQTQTDDLIGALDDYVAHGINTVAVFCMGSSGDADDPFNAAGTVWDAGHKARMLSIIDACYSRDIVVVVGIFYGKVAEAGGTINLSGWDESVEAVRTVTQALKDHGKCNIILNIANEQNSPSYVGEPFQNVQNTTGSTDSIIECMDAAHAIWPQLIVGGGGHGESDNENLADDSACDIVLSSTFGPDVGGVDVVLDMYNDSNPVGGYTKPHICIESFGGWTKEKGQGSDQTQGEFDQTTPFHVKNLYTTDTFDDVKAQAGYWVLFHDNGWWQGKSVGAAANRYDLAGAGTPADPGVLWLAEYIRDNA